MASVYDGLTQEKFDKFEKNTHYILYIGDEMEKTGNQNLDRILCGGGVGLANALFGGGGGMLAVPMLRRTSLDEKGAHATAILLILPISLFSFLLYAFKGIYDFSVLLPTALGVTLGGIIGAKLLGKLPVKIVGLTFAALQFAAGVFLIL